MNATAILGQLAAAGVQAWINPERPDRLKLAPADKLTAELMELARKHKAELLRELRERAPEPTYTRCLDCTHYKAPRPDTAFWCPLVKAHPEIALWAICTGYVAKPGTPPGPTRPPEAEAA